MAVVAENGFLVKYDKKGNKKGIICNQVEVEANIVDLISGDTCMKLQVYRDNCDDSYLLDRKNFDVKNLFEFLNSKNVKVLDYLDVKADVYDYVAASDDLAPDVYEHKKLGFVTINGELCFLAHHPIGITDPVKATSTFHDPQVTEPVGTMDGWLEFVNTEIIGHAKLELALALAALGPITYLLRSQMVITTNPAINIAGTSSIGKTTFLRICASVFGCPDETTGLISDFHATENAFVARLAQCHGLPMLCDESTLQPDWDFTKFGYGISKGVDKLRCNQDGSLQEQHHFFSPVIITGETKLLDQTQKNEGLYARFVTITQPLTDSAEQAERITAACFANYGHAVYPLIEWLLKNPSFPSEVYNRYIGMLKKEIKSSNRGVPFRILKSFALILTAAKVARAAWNINVSVVEICKFLLSIFDEQLPETDRITAIYEKLMAGVAANYSKFPSEKGKHEGSFDDDCWGKFTTSGGIGYYWVSSLGICKILGDEQVLDLITLKALHAAGLIKHFKDRYKKPTMLGKTKVACYCFISKSELAPVERGNRSINETPQLKFLLSDDEEETAVDAKDETLEINS